MIRCHNSISRRKQTKVHASNMNKEISMMCRGQIKIHTNKDKHVKSKESTIQNLKAWIKFQKYANINL